MIKNNAIKIKYLTRITGFVLPVVALLVIMMPSPALAVSLSVSPGRLNVNLSNDSAVETVSVVNNGSDTCLYKVYVADNAYEEFISIEPQEFLLSPGQTMSVKIIINSSAVQLPGSKAYINVVSLPDGSGLKIGAGIRVPVYFTN
jgi:P pilus assembly chaperone PapD